MPQDRTTPHQPPLPAAPDDDYGYDLSHERGGTDGPRTWRVAPRVQHRTSVPTPRADTEGGHGYDCAHEVPRRDVRR